MFRVLAGALEPHPAITRRHTFTPKELLEEWGDPQTGGDHAGVYTGPQRSGMFKPEWPLGTLLSLKLNFGKSMIVPHLRSQRDRPKANTG